jgi:hypothetical protein
MTYAIEMTSERYIHIKFHDNRFRNSSNIKGISTIWEAVVLVLLMTGIS